MAITQSDLVINQGASFSAIISVLGSDGNPLNLEEYDGARSQFRKTHASNRFTQFTAEFLEPLSAGKIQLTLTAEQTAAVKAGRYVYDVEIYSDDGYEESVFKVVRGEVQITPEATK